MDLVPNHTSNESVWFQEALNGNEKYYNYFVWEDAVIDENGNRQPPNNWVRHFEVSLWLLFKEIMNVMRKVKYRFILRQRATAEVEVDISAFTLANLIVSCWDFLFPL